MRIVIKASLVLFLMCAVDSLGCNCRISGNVSTYLKSADVVFLGKGIFSNDDGSSTFVKKTLVRFSVEEGSKELVVACAIFGQTQEACHRAMPNIRSGNDI
jgi:hypothetical protein